MPTETADRQGIHEHVFDKQTAEVLRECGIQGRMWRDDPFRFGSKNNFLRITYFRINIE
jgi:hypothetical protein